MEGDDVKTTLGTAANAQAAADMVARLRAVLQARGLPMPIGYPTTFGPGPAAIRGWSEELALDSASSTFEFFQCTFGFVWLRHKATDLIYRVMEDVSATYYADGKANLDAVNALGKTWLMDYFYYDTPKVFVQTKYALLDPNSSSVVSMSNARARPDIDQNLGSLFGQRPEVVDMLSTAGVGARIGQHCLGKRPSGELVLTA